MSDGTLLNGWSADEAPVIDTAANLVMSLMSDDMVWLLFKEHELDRLAVDYVQGCDAQFCEGDPLNLMKLHVFALVRSRMLQELMEMAHAFPEKWSDSFGVEPERVVEGILTLPKSQDLEEYIGAISMDNDEHEGPIGDDNDDRSNPLGKIAWPGQVGTL